MTLRLPALVSGQEAVPPIEEGHPGTEAGLGEDDVISLGQVGVMQMSNRQLRDGDADLEVINKKGAD